MKTSSFYISMYITAKPSRRSNLKIAECFCVFMQFCYIRKTMKLLQVIKQHTMIVCKYTLLFIIISNVLKYSTNVMIVMFIAVCHELNSLNYKIVNNKMYDLQYSMLL